MPEFKLGDIVALTAGSPRMAVEAIDGDNVSTLWCNEGTIHRDTFNNILLKKWETREGGDRGGRPGGGFKGGGKPYGGDRDGGGGGYKGGYKGGDGGDRKFDDRGPKGKPGWDGKPREKKFFRKD